MSTPPSEINKAKVLYWAWSSSIPFGAVSGSPDEIYGLVICQYLNLNKIYRFSCNKDWETQQDEPFYSVQQAMNELPNQSRNVEPVWAKFE